MADRSEWPWWWGINGSERLNGPHDLRESALSEAMEDACPGDTITLCRAIPMELDDSIDAWVILERFVEQNEDYCNEDGELLDMDISDVQAKELADTLTAAFKAWREKHKIGRSWALDVKDEETIVVPEEQDDSHLTITEDEM